LFRGVRGNSDLGLLTGPRFRAAIEVGNGQNGAVLQNRETEKMIFPAQRRVNIRQVRPPAGSDLKICFLYSHVYFLRNTIDTLFHLCFNRFSKDFLRISGR